MIGRALVVLLWVLLLAVGCLVIHLRQPESVSARAVESPCPTTDPSISETWVATRALPMNTRLDPEGVKWPGTQTTPSPIDLVGQFLGCSVPAGQPILAKYLRPVPEFPPVPGRVPYVLSPQDQPALIQVLNAGSVVDVWHDARPLLREVRVLAVTCGDKSRADCVLVLDLPVGDADVLARSDSRKLLLFVRRIRE